MAGSRKTVSLGAAGPLSVLPFVAAVTAAILWMRWSAACVTPEYAAK